MTFTSFAEQLCNISISFNYLNFSVSMVFMISKMCGHLANGHLVGGHLAGRSSAGGHLAGDFLGW